MAAPYPNEAADLTADGEAALRRAVEACGGYEVDLDVAKRCSSAHNFLADCEMIFETVWASRRPVPLDA